MRAEVGDQAHAGALADGGDTRDSGGFVRKRLGEGHDGPVGGREPEPEGLVAVAEEFECTAMIVLLGAEGAAPAFSSDPGRGVAFRRLWSGQGSGYVRL
ncbi:hypothetical protein [Arthrobacter sp. 2MCAF14]|uniref:hypothetical protein n=1 Tax=Arthrobacter sp. 2MCAF14 TaxID=3232982 RepID=UPI003F932479